MYALIVNPAAGNGRSLRLLPEIQSTLDREGIQSRVFETSKPGDATALAAAACRDGFDAVVSIGGDGTLLETASGMIGSSVPLLIAPCGTGNDFIRTLELPRDPIACLSVQMHSAPLPVDAVRVNDRYFLNVSGTGLDVDVLRRTTKHKQRFKGLIPYLLAVFESIRHYSPGEAEIRLDDGPTERVRFSLISIGNGRYFGGGMCAVPGALPNDGLLDVIVVKPVKKWKIPFLLVLFITGKHIKAGLGVVRQCKKLAISKPGATLNLDGELYDCDRAEYEVLPGAITLRAPGPGAKA